MLWSSTPGPCINRQGLARNCVPFPGPSTTDSNSTLGFPGRWKGMLSFCIAVWLVPAVRLEEHLHVTGGCLGLCKAFGCYLNLHKSHQLHQGLPPAVLGPQTSLCSNWCCVSVPLGILQLLPLAKMWKGDAISQLPWLQARWNVFLLGGFSPCFQPCWEWQSFSVCSRNEFKWLQPLKQAWKFRESSKVKCASSHCLKCNYPRQLGFSPMFVSCQLHCIVQES